MGTSLLIQIENRSHVLLKIHVSGVRFHVFLGQLIDIYSFYLPPSPEIHIAAVAHFLTRLAAGI